MNVEDIKALTETQATLLKNVTAVQEAAQKATAEAKDAGTVSREALAKLEALSEKAAELTDKCIELERKTAAGYEGGNQANESAGEQFIQSDEFKSMAAGRSKFARLEMKAAIINATGQNQPLVPDMRVPGIIANPDRMLTIRDLMPAGRTTSNLIQYTKENVFTNSAAPQATENTNKAESGITFTLANAPVVTLAHFIPVSRQVLDDAPQLRSYIDGRLSYGLKLVEEDQLLNGDGTGGNISGLLDTGNFVAYNRASVGDTYIDTLRKCITQAALAEYPVDAFVLNPADWEAIELTKATDGQYVTANPVSMMPGRIWGRPVVATNSIAAGTFLAGAFGMGCQLWDRMDAAVQISYEDGDNFKKNMATLLAEERLALTVYRPASFVSGTFA